MKERKVCSRAGSVTLLRKRSRYAVVVITSSSVSFTDRMTGRVGGHNVELVFVQLQCSIKIQPFGSQVNREWDANIKRPGMGTTLKPEVNHRTTDSCCKKG